MNTYFVSFTLVRERKEKDIGNIVIEFKEIRTLADVRRLEQLILDKLHDDFNTMDTKLVIITNFIKLRGL